MDGAEKLLASVFGFDSFRPGQAEIVDAVIRDQNVLAIMPTGGGKSLCFQLPAFCRDGVTVVISPLIALMRDQVRALRAIGVKAGALTSGNTDEETSDVFDALSAGRLRILYMAPERLASGGTLTLLRKIGVGLIAVDEAHCVSQWGHDFRPDYLRIGELKKALQVPLAAFTATADPETQSEIVKRLFGEDEPKIFLRGFDRPNIHLAFAVKDKPRQQILDFASARAGQSGIVYCATRAKTETLATALRNGGASACHYHGGMDAEDRRVVEARFQREDGLIVVATVAFGMGIDKPDIRWVAHADLPKSIESYYQEIGRAGRDGAPAETLTLFGAEDIRLRRNQIDESPSLAERRVADHGRLNALMGLAEALYCRRQTLLGYFGEHSEPCGHCDLCERPVEIFDGTESVRKALSAMLRTEERFGAGHVIDVLRGVENDKTRKWGHDRLPTFGVGKDMSRAEWQAILRQMMGRDLARPDPSRHGALRMTAAARPILRGDAKIDLRRDTISSATRKPAAKALVREEDAPLLAALKAKRRELAEAARVPAYIIFNDRTLIDMAEKKPATIDEMAAVSGVGAKKLDRYGDTFLEIVSGETVLADHPARRAMAGRTAGNIYDRLLAAQNELARGDGSGKPMRCTAGLLAKVAKLGSADRRRLEDLLGESRAERFGDAFLAVLADG